jgi:hypothetical protein
MYSTDFRKIVICKYKKYNNYRKVCSFFNISLSTLHSWVHNGIKQKKRVYTKRWLPKIKNFLIDYIKNNPFVYLQEIILTIKQTFKLSISEKTISRYLKQIKIVKKKAKHYRKEFFGNDKIKPFEDKLSKVKNEIIYSVDECYFSEKVNPLYGYCKKGETLTTSLFPKSWKKRSLLMIINSQGDKHFEIINGSVNKKSFNNFIKQFEDNNVLMDNVAFHKNLKNDNFIFTPPYCPQFKPHRVLFLKN